MDNMNDNLSDLKQELEAENKEWLEQLLGRSDTPPETAAEEAEALPAEADEESLPEVTAAQTACEEAADTTLTADDIWSQNFDTEPITADAPTSQDLELERILMEDWSNDAINEEPAAQADPPLTEDALLADILADAATIPSQEDTLVSEETNPEEAVEPFAVVADEYAEPPSEYAEEEIPEEETQKLRPKRKSGYGLFGIPHILATVIWLALIVAIGVSLGKTLWVCCADVMAFGKEARTVTITITEDDDIDSIAKKLGNAGLVRYPGLFKFFATVTDKADDIGAGTFTLNAQLDYNAMINAMYDYGPQREVVNLMFPEGYNCAQIFKLLEEKGVCTAAELEQYAAEGELKEYWFLEGVSRGSKYCLEGYLAPDTYKFYVGDSPRRVLEKFLDEFNDRFTDLMKEDFETIKKAYADRLKAKGFDDAYIQENQLTVHQVVTLASVIQKETSSDGECYDIASTFYNRLVNRDIMSLGADATVYYAIGDYFWETEELTQEHLDFDSPYNTRKYKGIPPGPICNMGVHALYAALEPNDTDYHYFVYDPVKLVHRFAATYSEHQKNLKELGY